MSKATAPLLITALALALLAPDSTRAVANRPSIPDSLGVEGLTDDPNEPLPGVATAYMIGTTLLEQGDAAGALPYLSHAYRLNPGQDEFAVAFRDALIALGYLRDALAVSRDLVGRSAAGYEDWMQHLSLEVALENYGEALEALDLCQAQHPDSLQLGMMKAEIQLRSHDWDAARDTYRDLLPRMPEEREQIYLALAEMAVLRERHEEAAALWEEGLAALPDSRPLRLGAIQHQVARGLDDAAMALAAAGDSLSRLEGPLLDTSWTRTAAGMMAAAGRADSAIQHLAPLFARDVLDQDTALLLGRLQGGRERWSDAIATAEEVVHRWPESAEAQLFLGEFKAASGDLFGGEPHVRRAIDMDPSDPDYLLSLISILSRRHPELFERGASLPDDDPGKREVLDLAARAQALLGPDDSAASHMMVGATYQAMGEHARSLASYELAARDPDLAREADLNRSLALDAIGRRDEARELLEALIADHPDDAVVQNALGYTLADQDRDLDRAERLIRSALSEDPENPAFLDSLGWLFYRRGDADQALDYLVQAANLLPEDPEILGHLGFVLVELERYDRALEILKHALALGGDPVLLEPAIADLEPAGP